MHKIYTKKHIIYITYHISHIILCRKYIENKDPVVLRTYIGRIMVSSNCAVYNCKQNRLIKWQEASGDFKDTICKLNITTSFELLLMK